MTRTLSIVLLCVAAWPAVLLCGAALPAAAAEPICAREAVLARLRDMITPPGRQVQIEPQSVAEVTSGLERQIHCAARARILRYDTVHYGMQGVDATFTVRYALQLRQNGMFIHLE